MPPMWSLYGVVFCSHLGANPERRQNEGRTKAERTQNEPRTKAERTQNEGRTNPERTQRGCVFLKSLDRFLLVKLISLSKNVFYTAKNRVPPLRKMNVETDYGNCKLGHTVVIIVILSSCHLVIKKFGNGGGIANILIKK